MVAEEGTLSAAAESLLVTQPTLTHNLQKLEQSLGVPLFKRSSRGVKLTPYGETLYENAKIMQRLYNNAMGLIEAQKNQREAGLSIGSGYTWWWLFLRRLVLDYANTYPSAPINVSLGNNLRCMDQLLSGDISLFIGHRIGDLAHRTHADFIDIGQVRDGYFVREGHPLLVGPQTQVDVRKFPLALAFPSEARHHRLLTEREYLQPGTRQPEYYGRAFTSNSLEACLDYVRGSDAVTRHTDLIAGEFSRRGLMKVEMAPGQEETLQPMGIYVLPERRSDRHVARIIDVLLEKAIAIVRSPPVP